MQGIDKSKHLWYNNERVKQKHPNRCVCCSDINSGGQTRIGVPERLFTSAFCMLYYYSIFWIHLSRAFRIFRIRPRSSLLFPGASVILHKPVQLNANVQLTDVLLLPRTSALTRVSAVRRLHEATTPTASAAGRRRPTRTLRISPSVTRGSANVRTVGSNML